VALLAADARDHARLEDAQHLGLRSGVHVADLVEEERASRGQLEPSLAQAVRR